MFCLYNMVLRRLPREGCLGLKEKPRWQFKNHTGDLYHLRGYGGKGFIINSVDRTGPSAATT